VTDSRPIWWTATEVEAPDTWRAAFAALTADTVADRHGLTAGIFIARVRRRTGRGPTFTELFGEVFKDEPLHPEWPPGLSNASRAAVLRSFRLHVAVQWKRRGWVSWDPGVARSLRVGRTFRECSRKRQAARTQ
jgi:hypothetical protein